MFLVELQRMVMSWGAIRWCQQGIRRQRYIVVKEIKEKKIDFNFFLY